MASPDRYENEQYGTATILQDFSSVLRLLLDDGSELLIGKGAFQREWAYIEPEENQQYLPPVSKVQTVIDDITKRFTTRAELALRKRSDENYGSWKNDEEQDRELDRSAEADYIGYQREER